MATLNPLEPEIQAEVKSIRSECAVLRLRCQQKEHALNRALADWGEGASSSSHWATADGDDQREAARWYAQSNGLEWDELHDRPRRPEAWSRLAKSDLYAWNWTDEARSSMGISRLDDLKKRSARLEARIEAERARAALHKFELHMRSDSKNAFEIPVDGTDIVARARGHAHGAASHLGDRGRLVWASHCLYETLRERTSEAKTARKKTLELEQAVSSRWADIQEAQDQTRTNLAELDRLKRLAQSRNLAVGILDEAEKGVQDLEREVSSLTKELIGLIDQVWLGPRAVALRQSATSKRRKRRVNVSIKDSDNESETESMQHSLSIEDESAAREDAQRTKRVLEKLMNRSFLFPQDPWVSTFTPTQIMDPLNEVLRRRQEKEGRAVAVMSERVKGLLVRSGIVSEDDHEPNLIKLEAFAES